MHAVIHGLFRDVGQKSEWRAICLLFVDLVLLKAYCQFYAKPLDIKNAPIVFKVFFPSIGSDKGCC